MSRVSDRRCRANSAVPILSAQERGGPGSRTAPYRPYCSGRRSGGTTAPAGNRCRKIDRAFRRSANRSKRRSYGHRFSHFFGRNNVSNDCDQFRAARYGCRQGGIRDPRQTDTNTVSAERLAAATKPLHPSGRHRHSRRADHRASLRPARPDHRAGDVQCLRQPLRAATF